MPMEQAVVAAMPVPYFVNMNAGLYFGLRHWVMVNVNEQNLDIITGDTQAVLIFERVPNADLAVLDALRDGLAVGHPLGVEQQRQDASEDEDAEGTLVDAFHEDLLSGFEPRAVTGEGTSLVARVALAYRSGARAKAAGIVLRHPPLSPQAIVVDGCLKIVLRVILEMLLLVGMVLLFREMIRYLFG